MRYVDPDGKTIWISFIEKDADGNDVYRSLQYKNEKLYGSDGKQYTGNNADALKTLNDLNELKSMDDVVSAKITTLERSKHSHEIVMTDSCLNDENAKNKVGATTRGVGSSTRIGFNPNSETDISGKKRSPLVALGHEISHSYDDDRGISYGVKETSNGIQLDEVRAVKFENRIRDRLGETLRFQYDLKPIPSQYFRDQPRRLRPPAV